MKKTTLDKILKVIIAVASAVIGAFSAKCDEPVRRIDLIVIHCSATREDRPFTEQDLETAHRLRGFDGIGYHFYVRRNGDIKSTRLVERVGAHVRGHQCKFNRNLL